MRGLLLRHVEFPCYILGAAEPEGPVFWGVLDVPDEDVFAPYAELTKLPRDCGKKCLFSFSTSATLCEYLDHDHVACTFETQAGILSKDLTCRVLGKYMEVVAFRDAVFVEDGIVNSFAEVPQFLLRASFIDVDSNKGHGVSLSCLELSLSSAFKAFVFQFLGGGSCGRL